MQFHNQYSRTGYLAAVLRNGARNYRYRCGIRSLVGLVDTGFRRAAPSSLVPPVGFRYLDARLSAGQVVTKKAPLPTTRTHGDAERGTISRKLEGTRTSIQTALSKQTMSSDGGPSRPQSTSPALSGGKMGSPPEDLLNKNKEAIAPEKESEGQAQTAAASHTINKITIPGDSSSYQQGAVIKTAQQRESPSAGRRQACMEGPVIAADGSPSSSHTPPSDRRRGQQDNKDNTTVSLCSPPHAAPLQREGEENAPACVKHEHASMNSASTDVPVATTREGGRSPSPGHHQSAEPIVIDETANKTPFDAEQSKRADHPTLLQPAMIMKSPIGSTAERYNLFSTEKHLLNPPPPPFANGKVRLHPSLGKGDRGGFSLSGVDHGLMDRASKKKSSRNDDRAPFRSAGKISLKKMTAGSLAAEQHSGEISKVPGAVGMPEETAGELVLGDDGQGAARTEMKESAAARIAHLLAHTEKRFKTALRQDEAAASAEAYAYLDPGSMQRQAEQIDEMRRAVQQMIAKTSPVSSYDQSEMMEHREPSQLLPAQVQRVYVVKRQAGRRSMPPAFWDRSYLGRCRLQTVR